MLFRDRADAGRQLAQRLTQLAGRADVAVLPLTRDSDAVAFEIVEALNPRGTAVRDSIVLVVADGLRDADDMVDFIGILRQDRPRRIIVATPVASNDARYDVALRADQVVCLATPEPFISVGEWYADSLYAARAFAGTY
jgi:predicted phosphoribosyltransferase